MKNAKHLLGYLAAILLTFFITKTYLCPSIPPPCPPDVECIVNEWNREGEEEPTAIITLDEVKSLYNGYSNIMSRVDSLRIKDETINDVKKLLVTRGVWFDYNDFKEYLSYIDKNAKDANITISGLRFFPGRSITKGESYDQLTLFYNPTYKNDKGEDIAYAIDNTKENKAIPLIDLVRSDNIRYGNQGKEKQEASIFSFSSATTTYAAEIQAGDRGQVNPPPEM